MASPHSHLVAGAGFVFVVAVFGVTSDSETLTMTTSYPAPSGVYQQVVTTGGSAGSPKDTLLARDYGNVGIATATPKSPSPDGRANGNLTVNDIYLGTKGQWMSTFNGGGFQNIQVFDVGGTFTVPAGVTKILVEAWGGGGGSGGSLLGSSCAFGGGGGGGGGYGRGIFSVVPSASYSVTVGQGGAAGAGGPSGGCSAPCSAGSGGNGTSSSFGSLLTSNGGKGGGGANMMGACPMGAFAPGQAGAGGGSSGGQVVSYGGNGDQGPTGDVPGSRYANLPGGRGGAAGGGGGSGGGGGTGSMVPGGGAAGSGIAGVSPQAVSGDMGSNGRVIVWY